MAGGDDDALAEGAGACARAAAQANERLIASGARNGARRVVKIVDPAIVVPMAELWAAEAPAGGRLGLLPCARITSVRF
jgi:hypothetical protein